MTQHPIVAVRLTGLDERTIRAAVAYLTAALGDAVRLAAPHHGRRDWLAYGTLHVARPHQQREAAPTDPDLRPLLDAARRLVAVGPTLPADTLFTAQVWQEFVAAVQQQEDQRV